MTLIALPCDIGVDYLGRLMFKNRSYGIHVIIGDGKLKDVSLDKDILTALAPVKDKIMTAVTKLTDANAVISEFQKALNSIDASVTTNNPAADPDILEQYLNLLESIGHFESIAYVSSDWKQFHLTCEDNRGRTHLLKIMFGSNEKMETETDLPSSLPSKTGERLTMADVYANFVDLVESLNPFWEEVSHLMAQVTILEPENIQPHHTKFRFALEENCTVSITIDPLRPRSMPRSCEFTGPDRLVEKHKTAWNSAMSRWIETVPITLNFEVILDVILAPCEENDGAGCNCVICYSYLMNGSIPDYNCEHCHKSYHVSCLAKWLKQKEGHRRTIGLVSGECPCCKKIIRVTDTTVTDTRRQCFSVFTGTPR